MRPSYHRFAKPVPQPQGLLPLCRRFTLNDSGTVARRGRSLHEAQRLRRTVAHGVFDRFVQADRGLTYEHGELTVVIHTKYFRSLARAHAMPLAQIPVDLDFHASLQTHSKRAARGDPLPGPAPMRALRTDH